MFMGARRCALCLLVAAGSGTGCRSRSPRRDPGTLAPPVGSIPASSVAISKPDETPARTLRRCFPDQPVWVDAMVSDLLDRAGVMFDRDDFSGALACAEEAARAAPRSVEAHHDRAAALLHLGRLDEARDALSMALALDPDDPQTLEASADFYINQLPPSADRSAVGLEQARRGFRRAASRDRARAARLALLEGQALIDLGRAQEAVRRLDAALAFAPHLTGARYEKAVAQFELCRFDDARKTFMKVIEEDSDHAHALYHLGLIDERHGDTEAAEKRFADASARDPGSFPPTPAMTQAEFEANVRKVLAGLAPDVRADIDQARLETAELPALDDLVAERPPLSPTILGLFRGLPLNWSGDAERRSQAGRIARGKARGSKGSEFDPAGAGALDLTVEIPGGGGEACASPARTIVLYRRNLLRSVRDVADLDDAIKRTLLHEVGHLRGEDDGSLRDRGLD